MNIKNIFVKVTFFIIAVLLSTFIVSQTSGYKKQSCIYIAGLAFILYLIIDIFTKNYIETLENQENFASTTNLTSKITSTLPSKLPSAPQIQIPSKLPSAPQIQIPSKLPSAPQIQIPPAPQIQIPPAPQIQIPPAPQIQIPPAPQLPLPSKGLQTAPVTDAISAIKDKKDKKGKKGKKGSKKSGKKSGKKVGGKSKKDSSKKKSKISSEEMKYPIQIENQEIEQPEISSEETIASEEMNIQPMLVMPEESEEYSWSKENVEKHFAKIRKQFPNFEEQPGFQAPALPTLKPSKGSSIKSKPTTKISQRPKLMPKSTESIPFQGDNTFNSMSQSQIFRPHQEEYRIYPTLFRKPKDDENKIKNILRPLQEEQQKQIRMMQQMQEDYKKLTNQITKSQEEPRRPKTRTGQEEPRKFTPRPGQEEPRRPKTRTGQEEPRRFKEGPSREEQRKFISRQEEPKMIRKFRPMQEEPRRFKEKPRREEQETIRKVEQQPVIKREAEPPIPRSFRDFPDVPKPDVLNIPKINTMGGNGTDINISYNEHAPFTYNKYIDTNKTQSQSLDDKFKDLMKIKDMSKFIFDDGKRLTEQQKMMESIHKRIPKQEQIDMRKIEDNIIRNIKQLKLSPERIRPRSEQSPLRRDDRPFSPSRRSDDRPFSPSRRRPTSERSLSPSGRRRPTSERSISPSGRRRTKELENTYGRSSILQNRLLSLGKKPTSEDSPRRRKSPRRKSPRRRPTSERSPQRKRPTSERSPQRRRPTSERSPQRRRSPMNERSISPSGRRRPTSERSISPSGRRRPTSERSISPSGRRRTYDRPISPYGRIRRPVSESYVSPNFFNPWMDVNYRKPYEEQFFPQQEKTSKKINEIMTKMEGQGLDSCYQPRYQSRDTSFDNQSSDLITARLPCQMSRDQYMQDSRVDCERNFRNIDDKVRGKKSLSNYGLSRNVPMAEIGQPSMMATFPREVNRKVIDSGVQPRKNRLVKAEMGERRMSSDGNVKQMLKNVDRDEQLRNFVRSSYSQNLRREERIPKGIYGEDYEERNKDMRKILIAQDNESNIEKNKFNRGNTMQGYDGQVIKRILNEESDPAPLILESQWSEWKPL